MSLLSKKEEPQPELSGTDVLRACVKARAHVGGLARVCTDLGLVLSDTEDFGLRRRDLPLAALQKLAHEFYPGARLDEASGLLTRPPPKVIASCTLGPLPVAVNAPAHDGRISITMPPEQKKRPEKAPGWL
jgi:hypothetical protein